MKRFAVLVVAVLIASGGPGNSTSRAFAGTSNFLVARSLLLPQRSLPSGYRLRSISTEDSVAVWDGNIRPVMQIDEQYGWMGGAQEATRDPRGKPARVSVQLFRTGAGARADFGQFFTNAHPETVYLPGATWLGGADASGLGRPATIYRIDDPSSGCPQSLLSGISFVFRNSLISVGVCLHSVGERGATVLAQRLLSHARSLR